MKEAKTEQRLIESPYPNAQSYDVVTDMSHREFVRRYASPGRPVVLRNAFGNLAARDLSPDELIARWGTKEFKYDGQATPLSEIVERTRNSTPQNPAPYLRSVDVESEFPELIPLLQGGVRYAWPNYRFLRYGLRSWYFPFGGHFAEFFLGGAGNGFPRLHVDSPPINTFSALFHGEKEWIVFDPEDADNLYMDDREFTDNGLDIFDPDFAKYPKLLSSKPVIVRQQAGDLAFIPRLGIHTARNLNTTVSVAWDQLAGSSWDAYISSLYRGSSRTNKPKAIMMNAYLRTLGFLLSVGEKAAFNLDDSKLRGRIV